MGCATLKKKVMRNGGRAYGGGRAVPAPLAVPRSGGTVTLDGVEALQAMLARDGAADLVMFYMAGCPFCDKLDPVYEQLARELHATNGGRHSVPVRASRMSVRRPNLAALKRAYPDLFGGPGVGLPLVAAWGSRDAGGARPRARVLGGDVPRTHDRLAAFVARVTGDGSLVPRAVDSDVLFGRTQDGRPLARSFVVDSATRGTAHPRPDIFPDDASPDPVLQVVPRFASLPPGFGVVGPGSAGGATASPAFDASTATAGLVRFFAAHPDVARHTAYVDIGLRPQRRAGAVAIATPAIVQREAGRRSSVLTDADALAWANALAARDSLRVPSRKPRAHRAGGRTGSPPTPPATPASSSVAHRAVSLPTTATRRANVP